MSLLLQTNIPGICLRALRDDDAADLCREADSTRISENVRDHFPYPYLAEHAVAFIDAHRDEMPVRVFAITREDRLIGAIGYHPQSDVYRFAAEIGFWLGESHWGAGIATAAIQCLTDYVFRETTIVRLYAGVFAYNTGSMRALEKAGYNKEGIFVQHVFKNARFWDEHRYYKLHDTAIG